MPTPGRSPLIVRVDLRNVTAAQLEKSANLLRRGGLVAFPTETVYGLGAAALNPDAVARVFAAKGRPARNPLIVHVAETNDARRLASEWPATAQALADAFWPGPLTLVVRKAAIVPDAVTAGGATVAVRVPGHPVAQALLRATGQPVAAPSANRSGAVSPTSAEHVLASLADQIDALLDSGPTPGGIESTVVDVTQTPARLLRPGLVTPRQIRAVLGELTIAARDDSDAPRSPGQIGRHYAPAARLEIAPDDGAARVAALAAVGLRVGWLRGSGIPERAAPAGAVCVTMPADATGYAARLYAALHELDAAGVAAIVAAGLPEDENWLAIRDRLERAARAD